MRTFARGQRGWALMAYLRCHPNQLQPGDVVTIYYAGVGPRQPYCRVDFNLESQP